MRYPIALLSIVAMTVPAAGLEPAAHEVAGPAAADRPVDLPPFTLAAQETLTAYRPAPQDAADPGPPAPAGERYSAFTLGGGFGFTADPSTFLATMEGRIPVTGRFSIGPLFQFGVSDNRTLVLPTINMRCSFDCPDLEDKDLSNLKPFVQGGIGLGYVHRDRGTANEDDVGFLFNFGAGLDYQLSENFSAGTSMLFNILPDSVAGENFIFSWQVVTLGFHF